MKKYEEAYQTIQNARAKNPRESVAALCKTLNVNPTLYYYGRKAAQAGPSTEPVKATAPVQASTKAKPKKESVAAGVAGTTKGKRFLLLAVSEDQLKKLFP